MKKTLFITIILVVAIISLCSKDQAKDAADDYIGNYTSTTTGWGDFVISKVDASSILLKESVVSGWTATAQVNGNTIDIPIQLMGSYYTWGTGTRTGNTISFAIREGKSSTGGVGTGGYGFTLLKK